MTAMIFLAKLFLFQAIVLSCQASEEETETRPKCGVYLAQSTIPGSGLGMFAGDRDYDVGEIVTLGDVVVPVTEQEWNTKRLKIKNPFLWDEYMWNGNVFPGMEEEGDDVDWMMAASPGVGAAANSYLSLVNVEDNWIQLDRGVSGDSPGAGAFSPYHERSFFAKQPIAAGGEIFVDYGTDYFSSRTHTYGYLPLPKSFRLADKLIKKFLTLKKKVPQVNKNHALWDDYWGLIKDHSNIWESSRVLNGLPGNQTEFNKDFFQKGGSAKQHAQRSIRDIEWLEEHGQCMDNIKVGPSENPDAGRGAFANRFIPKGGLVAPAPLIQLPEPDALKMFKPMDDPKFRGKQIPDIDGPMMYQLLLNYCFGHNESSVLLCPYGLLTGFINHSHENPNTKVVWSKEMRHPEWRDLKIKKWAKKYHAGVSIDFVALRDIDEDEEILIDYGESWERAWQAHVQNFVPRKNYIPAYELNKMDDLVYRTMDDTPYEVDHVQLWCRKYFIKKYYPDEKDDAQCRILKKIGDDRYMVQLVYPTNDDEAGVTEFNTDGILWNVPSSAFYFADMPYTRDHHLFDSFRHAMMFPDDIFPEKWKDLKEKTKKDKDKDETTEKKA